MKAAIEEDFSIRPASLSDAEQLATLFSMVYESSSHECKDVDNVRQSLRSTDRTWFVGLAGTQIAGCTAYQSHSWNSSWETGWTLTHPAYRNAGLCTQLVRTALNHLRRRHDFELAFAFTRSLSMYRISSERLVPRFIHTGHDCGLHIAAGVREYHLATVSNPRAGFRHVVPRSNQITHSDFVRRAILVPLSFSPVAGEYPPALVVGPPQGTLTTVGRTHVRYQFNESSPARDLHITGLESTDGGPGAVYRDLETFITQDRSALHVRAYVLVDKEDLLRHMRSLGFEIAAYMPAWYRLHGRRYDCVLVVKRNYAGDPFAHDLADIVSDVRRNFSEFYA